MAYINPHQARHCVNKKTRACKCSTAWSVVCAVWRACSGEAVQQWGYDSGLVSSLADPSMCLTLQPLCMVSSDLNITSAATKVSGTVLAACQTSAYETPWSGAPYGGPSTGQLLIQNVAATYCWQDCSDVRPPLHNSALPWASRCGTFVDTQHTTTRPCDSNAQPLAVMEEAAHDSYCVPDILQPSQLWVPLTANQTTQLQPALPNINATALQQQFLPNVTSSPELSGPDAIAKYKAQVRAVACTCLGCFVDNGHDHIFLRHRQKCGELCWYHLLSD